MVKKFLIPAAVCSFLLLEGCMGVYVKKAEAFEQAGDFKSAVEMWDKAVARDGHNIELLIRRGEAKSDMHDHKGAMGDFIDAIKIDSGYVRAWYCLGIEEYFLENYEGSLEALNRAILIKTGSVNPVVFIEHNFREGDVGYHAILLERGHAYYALDSIQKAFNDFSTCLKNNYEVVECSYYRGIIYYNYGYEEKALEDFGRVLRLSKSGEHYYDEVAEFIKQYF